MKNIYYLWSEIVRGNCLIKEEVPTFSHFFFWYILLINGTMREIKLNKGFVTKVDKEVVYLGYCKSEYQAAKRYDMAAKFFHGEFACLNFE